MNTMHCTSPEADPAGTEPSPARAESRNYDEGGRAPDPTDRYMRMLDRLADLGMALTEDLVANAREEIALRRAARAAAPAPEPAILPAAVPQGRELTAEERAAKDPAMLAFHRMTRAVRLCMALAVKFHTDRLDREQGIVKGRAAAKPRRTGAKAEIERRVTDAIEHTAEGDPLVEEVMRRALTEKLDDDGIERDLRRYTVGELVERICQDLGIELPASGGDAEDEPEEPAEAWPGAGAPLDGEVWAIDYQFFVDLGMATPVVPHYTGPPPRLVLRPLGLDPAWNSLFWRPDRPPIYPGKPRSG